MLKALLNKGGAGKSISRTETAERLSALMERHNELMYAYDAAINQTSSAQFAAGLNLLNKRNRDDIAKLSELILSAGSTPPLGTDIEPGDIQVGDADRDAVRSLIDLERSYRDLVDEESDVKHMLRTVATLDQTREGITYRLGLLDRITTRLNLR